MSKTYYTLHNDLPLDPILKILQPVNAITQHIFYSTVVIIQSVQLKSGPYFNPYPANVEYMVSS